MTTRDYALPRGPFVSESVARQYATPRGPFVVDGTTNAYTMTADQGSYALTGQAVTLKAARTVTAAQGTYTLTGQTVGVRATRTIAAAQGSYSVSGQTVGLRAARLLSLAQGAYALTGQTAGLRVTRTLPLAQGTYTNSGQDVLLRVGYGFLAGQGTYTLTGFDALLTATVVATDSGRGVPTGGWYAHNDRQLARLLRKRLQLEDDEDAIEAVLQAEGIVLPETVTQAAVDDPRRLQALVVRYAGVNDLSKRTQRAVEYAKRSQTALAYELALREIAKQLDDEEHAVLLTLAML